MLASSTQHGCLKFGRERESRSWDQLKKNAESLKEGKGNQSLHCIRKSIAAATGKDIPFQFISNFVDRTTLYKLHVLSESTSNTKMCRVEKRTPGAKG